MKWVDIPYALKLVATPVTPAVEPLTYDEVKAYPGLRLPNDTDTAYLTGLITAARQKVESDTGLRLITQNWDLSLDAFPTDAIYVPIGPLQSVTSIKTTSVAGVESTVSVTNYQVDLASRPPRVLLSDAGAWPGDIRLHQGIVIRLVVGYGASGDAVPAPLLEAMRIAIRCWYAPLGGTPFALPPSWMGYDALIAPYRSPGIG
jgi:uncharacterized phiE125 gp8 family phage protein